MNGGPRIVYRCTICGLVGRGWFVNNRSVAMDRKPPDGWKEDMCGKCNASWEASNKLLNEECLQRGQIARGLACLFAWLVRPETPITWSEMFGEYEDGRIER